VPTAAFPTTPIGWLVALVASLAGLLAGLATIRVLGGAFG
jgi:hypothetical protein